MLSKHRQTIEIKFKDNTRQKFTSVAHIAIFEDCHETKKGFDYDEPVLYIQQRRKTRYKREEKVTERVFPLSNIRWML